MSRVASVRPVRRRAAGSATPPTLADILAAVLPGRTARLHLDDRQKRALRDRDGRIGLDVVRHLVGARAASANPSKPPAPFPLTELALQAIAAKRGHAVGIKRCRAIRRRLVDTGVLEPAGSYRQPYLDRTGNTGYRVILYRAGKGVVRAVVAAVASERRLRLQPAVGRGAPVKRHLRRRWWQHPLFGDLHGLPPPGLSARVLRRMRSADELERTWR